MKNIGDRVLYTCLCDGVPTALLGLVTSYDSGADTCNLVVFDGRLPTSSFSELATVIHQVEHAPDDIPTECYWHERPTGV